MGLLHTTGRELGLYRALYSKCPEVHDINKKSVFYLDFDGVNLGLSNRFLTSPRLIIHSRSMDNFDRNRLNFNGRTNLELRYGKEMTSNIFKGGPFDVLIWWGGPKDKEEMVFLEEAKVHFKELVIFGIDEKDFTPEELHNLNIARFLGMALAYERITGKPQKPRVIKKPEAKVEVEKPKPKPAPKTKTRKKAAPKKKSGPRPLSGKDVTVGEMKTESETLVPTNIKSTSAKVQKQAEPHKEKVKRQAKKSRSKPKAKKSPAELLIESSSEQSKMEVAFMLNGKPAASIEEAESIIRSAKPEDLELVC